MQPRKPVQRMHQQERTHSQPVDTRSQPVGAVDDLSAVRNRKSQAQKLRDADVRTLNFKIHLLIYFQSSNFDYIRISNDITVICKDEGRQQALAVVSIFCGYRQSTLLVLWAFESTKQASQLVNVAVRSTHDLPIFLKKNQLIPHSSANYILVHRVTLSTKLLA